MEEGAFGGLMSGLLKGFSDTVLAQKQREHEEERQDKQFKLKLLQDAYNSGNYEGQDEDRLFSQMLDIVDTGKGGKGKSGQGGKEAAKKMFQAITFVPRLLQKAGRGGNNAVTDKLPDVPTRGSYNPNSGQKEQSLQTASDGLPPVPQRQSGSVSLPHAKTQEQKNQEALKLAGEKQRQEYAIEDEHQKAIRDRLPQDQQQELDASFNTITSSYKKYFGKDPDQKTRDRIFEQSYEKAFGFKPPTAGRAAQKLGIATVDQIPQGATDLAGRPIDRSNPKARFQEVLQDGEVYYEPAEDKKEKLSVAEQRMKDEMDELRATDPKLANAPDETVRKQALIQRAQKRRLQIANLQTSIAGKDLSAQIKKDLQDGKITPQTARAALSSTLQTAKVLNADPTSEYFMKGIDVIQTSLLAEAGFDRTELTKASGGKNVNTNAQDPDPMGILK